MSTKKKFLLSNLFLIFALAACKKKDTIPPSGKCYHCYSTNSGVPVVSKDTCGNLVGAIELKDVNGNSLNVFCVPK
jgi:hypothetical protein